MSMASRESTDFSTWTILEITAYLQERAELESTVIAALQSDARKGVRELLTRYLQRKSGEQKLLERLQRLSEKERLLRAKGLQLIAGVDEAGRGPLAGPVVAAAVVLDVEEAQLWRHIDDSKKLTPRRRSEQYEVILHHARAVQTAVVDAEKIDSLNIHRASLEAMRGAVENMECRPEYLLTDGYAIPGLNIQQEAVPGGDALCLSIAAASIVAKVTRDRIMQSYSILYPGYGFDRHKGYPTAAHKAAIKERGLSPIHRRSFALD